MDNLIGKKLDGIYQLQEQVGAGGMANVYKAEDLRNNQTVAVKILREEFSHDADLVRRFKNESRAISILNHPNIVKVYDISVTEKVQYIVMEYVDGITLKEYLNQRGGKITWRETLHFIGQILGALQHAHQNGVVHRDVKPQNIMLLSSGELKMMDFGIARISRAENQLVTGKAMGSVHYISPEQAKGDLTDAKSDIYSVGVMMYEMLSGQLPFRSGSVVEVAIKQISDTPQPLAEIAPELPHALVEITERAMAKQPENRYPDVEAMLADIQKFKQDPTISFEYKYMTDNAPVKVIDKVMKQNKTTAAQPQKKAASQKKKKRGFPFIPILCGITVAFAIGCAVLCVQIMENSNNPLFSKKEDVVLEDYRGRDRSEAQSVADTQQVKVEWVEEYNSNYEAGYVYKQSPGSGRTVKQGQVVTLTISMGTQYVTLEDYANAEKEKARQALIDQGVNVVVIDSVDESVKVGSVIRTEPAAGSTVEAGSTVFLYVSRTQIKTDTTVPEVVSLTLDDASKLLASKKLSVGAITQIHSDWPEGIVIEQAVAPFTEVRINDRIALTVSLGPIPVTWVPLIVGMDESEAHAALGGAMLFGSPRYEYSLIIPAG
ncbi:MAG: Stk1 family PASTA domain-containing Ser/Thr kinase, partial [Faecalibacterium sp.]|nr:Stk1 family PASTA domain-containing Ser/Thr kinase [Faecalibacterium sp.]